MALLIFTFDLLPRMGSQLRHGATWLCPHVPPAGESGLSKGRGGREREPGLDGTLSVPLAKASHKAGLDRTHLLWSRGEGPGGREAVCAAVGRRWTRAVGQELGPDLLPG